MERANFILSGQILVIFLATLLIVKPANSAYPEVPGLDAAIANCRESQKVFAIIQPIGPGIIGSELMKNPLYDYCVMVQKLAQDLDYARNLEKRGKTNDLTRNKWDTMQKISTLLLVSSYSNVDFSSENENARSAAKKRAKKSTFTSMYLKNRGIDVERVNIDGNEEFDQAQSTAKQMAWLERRRVVLTELSSCPVPEDDTQKKKVESELEPAQIRLMDYHELREEWFTRLMNLSNSMGPQKEYREDLKRLHATVISMPYTSKEVIGDKMSKSLVNGEVVMKREPLRYNIQTFRGIVKEQDINKFFDKYSRKWSDKALFARDAAFNSLKTSEKCEYNKNLKERSQAAWDKWRKDKPTSNDYIMSNCDNSSLKKTDSYKKLFFENAMNQYRIATAAVAQERALVLTKMSESIRGPVMISNSANPIDYVSDERVCDRELSFAEMKRASLENRKVSLAYRAAYAEAMRKKSLTLEQRAEEKRAAEERARFEEKRRARDVREWERASKSFLRAIETK